MATRWSPDAANVGSACAPRRNADRTTVAAKARARIRWTAFSTGSAGWACRATAYLQFRSEADVAGGGRFFPVPQFA